MPDEMPGNGKDHDQMPYPPMMDSVVTTETESSSSSSTTTTTTYTPSEGDENPEEPEGPGDGDGDGEDTEASISVTTGTNEDGTTNSLQAVVTFTGFEGTAKVDWGYADEEGEAVVDEGVDTSTEATHDYPAEKADTKVTVKAVSEDDESVTAEADFTPVAPAEEEEKPGDELPEGTPEGPDDGGLPVPGI